MDRIRVTYYGCPVIAVNIISISYGVFFFCGHSSIHGENELITCQSSISSPQLHLKQWIGIANIQKRLSLSKIAVYQQQSGIIQLA